MKPKTQLNLPTNKQTGLTLIEIMIAITLSLFLLGGLMQMVSSNKQTYRVQDAMARVQENGRFSLHFLSKDIRMAGYMGCSNSNGGGLTVTNNVKADAYDADTYAAAGQFDGNSAVEGYSYTTGTLPTELTALGLVAGTAEGNIMENTDVIFLRRAASCPGGQVESHNNANSGLNSASMKIKDNTFCQIQQDDIVMVSNCETAEIFGVSNVVSIMWLVLGVSTISLTAPITISAPS
jgi:type IV pilus assembly protein PilW